MVGRFQLQAVFNDRFVSPQPLGAPHFVMKESELPKAPSLQREEYPLRPMEAKT